MTQLENQDAARIRRNVGRIAASFETRTGRRIGCIRNVSREGLFVTANHLPTPDEPVVVTFTDLRGRAVCISGSVRWTTRQDAGRQASEAVFGGFGVLLDGSGEAFSGFYRQILEA